MNTIQSVQWMWTAVTVAGLSGAYMGYNRYLTEDQERRDEFVRTTILEKEKERKAAEATERMFLERKRMRAEAAQMKKLAEAPPAAPLTLSKRITDKSTGASAKS